MSYRSELMGKRAGSSRPGWRLALVGLLALVVACASPSTSSTPAPVLPDFLAAASPEVRELYAYALAHPEILSFIPCYCGCVEAGHRSNRDCYVQKVQANGVVSYSNHAYG